MAMAVGGGKHGAMVDMNVTPLIDVLLVLIIIFMVITPLQSKGLDALVPQPNPNQDKNVVEDPGRTIVISIDAENRIRINQEAFVPIQELGERLDEIFRTRNERIIFINGDPSLTFGDVARVIDVARGAGIDKIGLLPKALQQS